MDTIIEIDNTLLDESLCKINKFFKNKKNISQAILNGIINFAKNYVEIYECNLLLNDIFNSKVTELIEIFKNSTYIIELINDNTITPDSLASMKPHELNPDKYKHIIEKKAYEHSQKKQKGTSIFSCKKCKQSNCDVVQRQTRSADEPATTFVTCLECNFSFRF